MAILKNMKSMRLIFAFAGLLVALAFAQPASAATVQRPFPAGINTSSADKAWKQVQARAEVDGSYATAIARASGSSAFASANYEVVGYGKVTGGTNSAVAVATGRTVGVGNTPACHKGAKALILRDKQTSATVEICTKCGNVRLKKGTPVLRSVKWKKGTTLKINRTVNVKFTGKCPDGRTVSGTIALKVTGTIRAKAWGTVAGRLKVKVQAAYTLAVKAGKVKLDCGPGVAVTPPIVQQVIVCGNGSQQVGNGNAAVVVGDHCKTVTPPPAETCPDGRPLPANRDCDRPPTGEIDASAAHVQTGGRHVQLYFIGDDEDGNDVVLDILLSGPEGTYVSGKKKVTQFSDPDRTCPSDKTCWEARLWSGNTAGNAIVRGKLTAGGKEFISEPTTVLVATDGFPVT